MVKVNWWVVGCGLPLMAAVTAIAFVIQGYRADNPGVCGHCLRRDLKLSAMAYKGLHNRWPKSFDELEKGLNASYFGNVAKRYKHAGAILAISSNTESPTFSAEISWTGRWFWTTRDVTNLIEADCSGDACKSEAEEARRSQARSENREP